MTLLDDTQATQPVTSAGPSGIGGWLLIPIFALVVNILLSFYNIFIGLRDFGTVGWANAYAAAPDLVIFALASVAGALAFIALSVWCLYLMSAKDYRVPKFMIWYYAVMVVLGTIEGGLLYYFADKFEDPSLIATEPRDTIRAWIAAAIWIPYFQVSKRVQNTFVRRT